MKRDGLRVEARAGYYAPRDFAHTSRMDRETQLQDQLMSPVSPTDIPVLVTGGWFRLSADRYYVPVSIAVPGSAVPVPAGKNAATLDVMGMVRDEQGRPVGRIRQTMEIPAGGKPTLEGRQVLYQSGVTLPPGRFGVKVVVRENTNGLVGSFEAPLIVPELKAADMKVSSVVLSTQLQPQAARTRSDNPLVRDGLQLIPNLTHVIGQDQRLFLYFEVYDPSIAEGSAHRTAIDATDRRAAVFRLEVPAGAFKPGLYTCQVNIIDTVAGRFAFPRLKLLVR